MVEQPILATFGERCERAVDADATDAALQPGAARMSRFPLAVISSWNVGALTCAARSESHVPCSEVGGRAGHFTMAQSTRQK